MKIVSSGRPSLAQKRFGRVAVFVIPALGIVLGCWDAADCSRTRFGYIAGYNYAVAVLLSCEACVISLIYWRTRRFGIALICCGLLNVATFYAAMALLIKTDHVAWRHEPPMQDFGPNQAASLVIYFRHGVTNQQIERFISEVLEQDTGSQDHGRDYPAFVGSYLRLAPDQANGFDACALTLRPRSSERETDAYVNRIEADPRVAKVFRNVIPNEISINDSPSGPKAR